ncbi:MAG: hypothetical protein ABIH23_34080, partial [bacterium]
GRRVAKKMQRSTQPDEKRLMFVVFQTIRTEKKDMREEYLLFGGVFSHADDLLRAAKTLVSGLPTEKQRFSAYGDYPIPEGTAKQIFFSSSDLRKNGADSNEDTKNTRVYYKDVEREWDKNLQNALKKESRVVYFGVCIKPPRQQTSASERREERNERVQRYARITEPTVCRRCR